MLHFRAAVTSLGLGGHVGAYAFSSNSSQKGRSKATPEDSFNYKAWLIDFARAQKVQLALSFVLSYNIIVFSPLFRKRKQKNEERDKKRGKAT